MTLWALLLLLCATDTRSHGTSEYVRRAACRAETTVVGMGLGGAELVVEYLLPVTSRASVKMFLKEGRAVSACAVEF